MVLIQAHSYLRLVYIGAGHQRDGAPKHCMNELIYSTQPATHTPGWAGGVWDEVEGRIVGDVGLSLVVFCGRFG